MSFVKRFGWYLIGLSIGLIFLAVFLRKKSDSTGVEFCYLPNCRVLKALRTNPLQVDPRLSPFRDTAAVRSLLRSGEVHFKESQPRAEPCGVFVVTGEYEGRSLRLTLENCTEYTHLVSFEQQ